MIPISFAQGHTVSEYILVQQAPRYPDQTPARRDIAHVNGTMFGSGFVTDFNWKFTVKFMTKCRFYAAGIITVFRKRIFNVTNFAYSDIQTDSNNINDQRKI